MKTAGSCTQCGVECYEVVKRRPVSRAPLKLGRPLEHACKATFALIDGTTMDLTLCASCVGTLTPVAYNLLWQSCMEAWVTQSGASHQNVKQQANNGIVGLMHARNIGESRG